MSEKSGEIFLVRTAERWVPGSYKPEETALFSLLILLPRVLDVHKGRVAVRLLDVGVGEGALVAENVVIHGLL